MIFLREVIFIFFIAGVVSCGLSGFQFGSGPPGPFTEDSTEKEDTSAGVFNSPSGPLESEDVCFDNKNCVELCDSMLERFLDQKKCYDHTEKEVQFFRDVYNLLALGVPRKIEEITPSDIDTFLLFGPELWKDAIYGFERGKKEENCIKNNGAIDPTAREDCKFDNYYEQLGYDYEGANSAMQWITDNDWLAELIEEHDKDQIILRALVSVLNDPRVAVNRIEEDDDYTRCPAETEPRPSLPFTLREEEESIYITLGANCINEDDYFNISVQERNNYALIVGHELLETLCNENNITCTVEPCKTTCINHFYCSMDNRTAVLSYIKDNKVLQGFKTTEDDCL